MVFFNYATMQMAAKIVYYGPGLCGKTTNLHVIYGRTAPTSRGEMVCLETETDRTLFFDLLPLSFKGDRGFSVRLKLFTVPGQVIHASTRRLVLQGADGVAFIADSQLSETRNNAAAFRWVTMRASCSGSEASRRARKSCVSGQVESAWG